jgi:hypothetical protein
MLLAFHARLHALLRSFPAGLRTAIGGKSRQLRAELRGSGPDAGKIPGVLGVQNVLNGVSMAVGVMEKALYSSYALHERTQ